MPFGVWTRHDPKNHVLGGGPDSPHGKGTRLGALLGHANTCPPGRYSEPCSQGAATIRPLPTTTVATCFYFALYKSALHYFIVGKQAMYTKAEL